jgi:hypothetical protein
MTQSGDPSYCFSTVQLVRVESVRQEIYNYICSTCDLTVEISGLHGHYQCSQLVRI